MIDSSLILNWKLLSGSLGSEFRQFTGFSIITKIEDCGFHLLSLFYMTYRQELIAICAIRIIISLLAISLSLPTILLIVRRVIDGFLSLLTILSRNKRLNVRIIMLRIIRSLLLLLMTI